jgi:RHS repeat-associated protein
VAAITRFIWDGDQLLAEFRAPGGPTDNLDAPTAIGRQFGEVVYVHGPGIDAPLGIYRKGFSSSSGPTLIVPYTNWRGQYERGSFLNGDPECDPQNPQQPCIEVVWPAPKLRTNLYGQSRVLGDWVGSLIHDQLGQSGLLFRRNRYYDPQTGLFTQQDPIGLAGGLNLFGFADGDPVNFSDPLGLFPLIPAACAAAPAVCAAGVAAAARIGAAAARTPTGQRIIERGSALARNLAQSGMARQAGEAAHHIVAKAAAIAQPARERLLQVGVQIDEAVNGVFLPAVRDYTGQAANHLTLHTQRYYQAVNDALANVQTRQEALEALRMIRDRLLAGTFVR